ncbi:MAG: hypothetical protein ACE15C_09220 [Phycisphaerae bacterium]
MGALLAGNSLVTVALVVACLYLAVKWQLVRRPFCYLVASAGILLGFAGEFFQIFDVRALAVIGGIFVVIGNVVAFGGLVAACYGEKLPGVDDSKLGAANQPPKPPTGG